MVPAQQWHLENPEIRRHFITIRQRAGRPERQGETSPARRLRCVAKDSRVGGSRTWVAALGAALALALAIYFVVTALIGMVRWSHPIPYWDMWDGHLSFWFQLQDGNTAIWWELSNEHHLLLLKAIFWLDLAIFSGSTTFLLAVTMTLLAVLTVILILILGKRLAEANGKGISTVGYITVAAVIVTIVTAWMQGEDLTIGYHSQWVLITLLPIATFFFIGLTAQDGARRPRVYYAVSIGLTILTPWAAASGLVAPFIAAGLAYLLGLTWKRAIPYLVIGFVSIAVYSIGHPLTGGSDGPIANFLAMPFDVIRFWLLYLGGPWSRVTENQWIGGVAGAVFVIIVTTYVLRMILSRQRSTWGLVSVAFPLFMLLMALVTAAGRISYGIEQVSALRYLTPMLTAWACLLILAAPGLIRSLSQGASLGLIAVFLIPVLLLPEQARALQPPNDTLHQRDTATLAVALNALDPAAIGAVYPISPDRPLALGQRAMAEGIGVLGGAPYPELAGRVGTSGPFAPATSCFGWLDSRAPLEGSNWDRVDGWVLAEGHDTDRGVFPLTNSSGVVVGFVTTGKPRPDVQSEFPDSSGLNGFSGYLDRSAGSADVFVVDDAFRCSNPLTSAIP